MRLLLGMFGNSGPPTEVAPARVALGAPPALLALLGVVGFFVLDVANEIVGPAAADAPSSAGAGGGGGAADAAADKIRDALDGE